MARSWTRARGQPRRCKRQADVLEARQRRQQVEELEDEPDGVSPDLRELVVRKAAERLAADPHFAGGGPIEAADEIEQRRFPGAGRPDDRHHLTLGDGQGDAAQGADVALAGEPLGDLVELNHGFRSGAGPALCELFHKTAPATPGSRSGAPPGARLHPSGPAEADRDFAVRLENDRDGTAALAQDQHLLELGRILLDVDVLERDPALAGSRRARLACKDSCLFRR